MTDVQAPPSRQSDPRPEQPAPVATEDRPAVLVVGPRADARGGVGSVQFVLEQHAGALADLEVVTTHRDGSVRTRLWAMAGGTAHAARRIVVGRPAVAHMHVSQRALARTLDELVADDEHRRALGRRAREDAEPYSAKRWAVRLAAIWAAA